MNWKACELHSHTVHSDGAFTVEGLLEGAADAQLDLIAITDHNTMAAHDSAALAVQKNHQVQTIKGCELTTYYGHVLSMGASKDVHWLDIGRYDGNQLFDRIREAGGLVGIAHPFRNGYPVSTGTYFNYLNPDWYKVDYIEVWSNKAPSFSEANHKAMVLWHKRLNAGQRISATAGRDWHCPDPQETPYARTYLTIEDADDPIELKVKQAIKSGRIICSYGPMVNVILKDISGGTYTIGDTIPRTTKEIEASITITTEGYSDIFNVTQGDLNFKVNSNQGLLSEGIIDDLKSNRFHLNLNNIIWLNFEVHGFINQQRTMVAFTNPIYVS